MSVKNIPATEPQASLPRDEYSVALRHTSSHPTGVTKQSVVELVDDYGNSVTWVIKTVRIEGNDPSDPPPRAFAVAGPAPSLGGTP